MTRTTLLGDGEVPLSMAEAAAAAVFSMAKFSHFLEEEDRWKRHRKDPACVVGAHTHCGFGVVGVVGRGDNNDDDGDAPPHLLPPPPPPLEEAVDDDDDDDDDTTDEVSITMLKSVRKEGRKGCMHAYTYLLVLYLAFARRKREPTYL